MIRWVKNYLKHLPEAISANVRYRFPSKGMVVVGVTGTDGKTTTVNMIYKILKDAGKKVSMISTINAVIGEKEYDTGLHVTSPRPSMMQKYLYQAKLMGSQYMILEVTSHALNQFRVWGVKFDIGVITNVTHEHLDYHKTLECYLQTKARLIKRISVAILNRDDKHFEKLKKLTSGKVVSFGLTKQADFNPLKFPLRLVIPGEYNMYNALAAAAVAVNLGVRTKFIKESLEKFETLPGRMQEVKNNLGIKVVVDFAHTPNALDNALRSLKLNMKNASNATKLITVFGCAGDRDVLKRPLMGEVSAKLSDTTILTDEDPRNEDSNKIAEEIAAGARGAGAREGENLFKEPDREKAIKLAIKMANKGDVVGIFGKGHETSMNYSGVEKPWSDVLAVQKILNNPKGF